MAWGFVRTGGQLDRVNNDIVATKIRGLTGTEVKNLEDGYRLDVQSTYTKSDQNIPGGTANAYSSEYSVYGIQKGSKIYAEIAAPPIGKDGFAIEQFKFGLGKSLRASESCRYVWVKRDVP